MAVKWHQKNKKASFLPQMVTCGVHIQNTRFKFWQHKCNMIDVLVWETENSAFNYASLLYLRLISSKPTNTTQFSYQMVEWHILVIFELVDITGIQPIWILTLVYYYDACFLLYICHSHPTSLSHSISSYLNEIQEVQSWANGCVLVNYFSKA